jgi:hypothetical protein
MVTAAIIALITFDESTTDATLTGLNELSSFASALIDERIEEVEEYLGGDFRA